MKFHHSLAGAILTLVSAGSTRAGMPAVLPNDIRYVWQLTDSTFTRLQAISFFVVVFLLAALAFRWIWNSLQFQFPRLPKLSYPRAVGLMAIWGLLAIVVLTMISGARELMTPGAWEKQGLTYKVAAPAATTIDPNEFTPEARRQALERLKIALWNYADTHDGKFPVHSDEISPSELWQLPGAPQVRFLYVPALQRDSQLLPSTERHTKDPFLVYEPAIEGESRWLLSPSGEIRIMQDQEFHRWQYPRFDE